MVRSQTATGASLQQRGRSARVDLVHAGAGAGRVEVQQLLLQIDVIVENWGVAAHESLFLHTHTHFRYRKAYDVIAASDVSSLRERLLALR